jgi:hypothetical protein
MSSIATESVRRNEPMRWADAVEKGFCGSLQARLIQDQLGMRNIDSRDRLARFDCCAFLFYSFFAVTFSTASTNSGRAPIRNDELRTIIPHVRQDRPLA